MATKLTKFEPLTFQGHPSSRESLNPQNCYYDLISLKVKFKVTIGKFYEFIMFIYMYVGNGSQTPNYHRLAARRRQNSVTLILTFQGYSKSNSRSPLESP